MINYNLIFSTKEKAEEIEGILQTSQIKFGNLPSIINDKFSLMTFNPKNLGVTSVSYPYNVTNDDGKIGKLKIIVKILNPNKELIVY